ncbi:hypothetical protein Amsp01_026300 [Amycolatopsis sp. NBRC 101858]|uniref:hypothetical protein n=1 Tax=Amycolatopsis sp. NBRC 101858 TaxID=3032200 RepID=UPI0024A231FA|nr:hypothetical protein [Amycolatopsis sp. NBRC 101858]GLY36606.1 hypothetical protein Amsp01_026300 [Amycolatopsis sp. NBRC 101858]
MGAVLRNTGDRIAHRTRVTLKVVVSVDGLPPGPIQGPLMTREIPVLMPGQRVGVGRPLVDISAANRVVSADVEVGTTTWLPADVVRYTESSANCRALTARRTAVVFRDVNGKIVDGGLLPPDGKGNPAGSSQQAPSSPSCSPGERSTWVVPLQNIPPGTDDKRTELFSYCDLNAPPSDVNAVD